MLAPVLALMVAVPRAASLARRKVKTSPSTSTALAWLAPLAVAKIFVRYPRYQQKALGWAFMLGMTLPVL